MLFFTYLEPQFKGRIIRPALFPVCGVILLEVFRMLLPLVYIVLLMNEK